MESSEGGGLEGFVEEMVDAGWKEELTDEGWSEG